jgi:CDP-6-deoxy-D-xylo-4-hexulose-3-dehydrase
MKWPLAINSYTIWDKLKIASFFLFNDKWTQGERVKEYERKWAQVTGSKHAIMTSSGSTANELIFLRLKHELELSGQWPAKNKIIFPVINWISSISPAINLGFEPVFIDVNSEDIVADQKELTRILQRDSKRKNPEICAVFSTTLLGKSGGINTLIKTCSKYNVRLFLDNCESSFSEELGVNYNGHGITSSTSTYFSHNTSSVEGGFIFCASSEEADFYRMMRSHGMTREMPDKYKNKMVDSRFDFALLGSNYRATDIQAYIGLQCFDRDLAFSSKRIKLSRLFYEKLSSTNYLTHLFSREHLEIYRDVPFSLPIIIKKGSVVDIKKIKTLLETLQIESRPIVGGNLLRQTAFKKFGDYKKYINAEHIHENGLYIGLHNNVTEKMVITLAEKLNSIV